MSISDTYRNRVNDIYNNLSMKSGKCIVFFKGFSAAFYKELAAFTYFGLKDSQYTNSLGYIDANKLAAAKNDLMIRFLTNSESFLWGYYEEFLVLTESLVHIKESFNGDIYIIINNLFEDYYFIDIEEDIKEKLWDYHNSDDLQLNPVIDAYTMLYSNILKYNEGQYGLSYMNKHIDEGIEEIPFYDSVELSVLEPIDGYTPYFVNDFRFELLKNDVQHGRIIGNVQIIIEKEEDKNKVGQLQYLAAELGLPLAISFKNNFNEEEANRSDIYLPLLRDYWGPSSEFRQLKFYKNPEVSTELVDISQGQIICDIIQQSEKALRGDDTYRDIFITSPTGSGKSLLFQLPAIHLATNHAKAVTIVITPLIALMQDQVESMQNEHNISFATFINSDIPFQERERRIYGIKNCEYSIIYVSPEFFLSHSLVGVIGDRPIGLLVIDEAHLVTTWGRDFRVDYWYLGDYVEKQRKSQNFSFPILCLTATAVYLGNDDVVYDTVSSLNLRNHKLYLGNVRRDDILFDIRYFNKNQINGNVDNFKIDKTIEQIEKFHSQGTKSIVYCPYASQVEEIYDALPKPRQSTVGKYYGKLDKYEKESSYENFKLGIYTTMICTKAFGMGVDISDIEVVYHYAPTGNLADYVQEIGREARRVDLQGIAMTDFTDKDMKYIRMLYGLSNIKHYQLKEMISKIYNIYKEKGNRNFLVSTEAFSYLFSEEDLENKVKNGLLLISKDLEAKLKFPVLIVRPKSMFTKNFINVPDEIQEEFLREYHSFVKKVKDVKPRIIPSVNKRASDTLVYNLGTIYEMNMSMLWEQRFNDLTFAQFKWKFFNGELLQFSKEQTISPRINVIIHYEKSFAEVSETLKRNLQMISSIMANFKSSGKFFTKKQFREVFHNRLGSSGKNKELANLILDNFIADISQNIGFNQNLNPLKFIQARKAQGRDETEYRVMNSNYTRLLPYFTRLLEQSHPNMDEKTFSTYIPLGRGNKQHDLVQLAIYLELFGLASYEIIGGKNIEIFLRVNDPAKLRKIVEGNYRNHILTDIEKKRKRSEKLLASFLRSQLSNQQRWDVIEDYFLGREENVSHMLGIEVEDTQLV